MSIQLVAALSVPGGILRSLCNRKLADWSTDHVPRICGSDGSKRRRTARQAVRVNLVEARCILKERRCTMIACGERTSSSSHVRRARVLSRNSTSVELEVRDEPTCVKRTGIQQKDRVFAFWTVTRPSFARCATSRLSSHVGFYCVSLACKRVIRRGANCRPRSLLDRRPGALIECPRGIEVSRDIADSPIPVGVCLRRRVASR